MMSLQPRRARLNKLQNNTKFMAALGFVMTTLDGLSTEAMIQVLDSGLHQLQTRLAGDKDISKRASAHQVMQARRVLEFIAQDNPVQRTKPLRETQPVTRTAVVGTAPSSTQ